jgi:hypothetical protein
VRPINTYLASLARRILPEWYDDDDDVDDDDDDVAGRVFLVLFDSSLIIFLIMVVFRASISRVYSLSFYFRSFLLGAQK